MVAAALDAMAGTRWGRWLGLVTAVWVQCISGNNYTFSNYSDALKTLMGLTQLQLNGLSVAKDVGKAFGLLAGLASDRVPTWLLLAIGSLEGLLGYGAQWMVVSGTVAPLPYWQMCVFLCLGGNSTTWMNTAVLVTCIRNFRRSRGPVSGLLKGYVGLSTAVFTDICSALFADNPASFLGEEHTIAEALTSLDFWLMFASFLMGVGTGLAVMNNLGQMGVAMGYDDVSLFVSMTSIWGFFGRIASGTISEHFIRYVTLLPSLPIPCISSGTICAEVDMESRIMELEILRTEMRLDHDHRTGTGNRNSPRLCSSLDRPSVVVRSRWWIVGSAWKSQCRDSFSLSPTIPPSNSPYRYFILYFTTSP